MENITDIIENAVPLNGVYENINSVSEEIINFLENNSNHNSYGKENVIYRLKVKSCVIQNINNELRKSIDYIIGVDEKDIGKTLYIDDLEYGIIKTSLFKTAIYLRNTPHVKYNVNNGIFDVIIDYKNSSFDLDNCVYQFMDNCYSMKYKNGSLKICSD